MESKDRDHLNKEFESAERQLAECKTSEADKLRQIAELLKKEERFNLFIENFPDPIISYSLNGSIQYVNKKTEEATGYSRDELVGKNISDSLLVSDSSIPIIEASLDRQTRIKHEAPHEIEGLSKSGAKIFFEVVGVPVNVKGKSEVFVIARDITKKKLADQKAEHLESVLQSIRSANISSNSKRNRELILGKACNELIRVRKYHNAWSVVFDEKGNLIASAKAEIGHEFKSIINQLNTGKLPKCIKSSLRQDAITVTDNPLMDCCECPLSMLYYGKGCMSVRFKYNRAHGVIVASVPGNIVNEVEEHGFLREVAEYLSSALHNIELEEEAGLIEGSLRKSEEKYKNFFEHANEAICVVQDSLLRLFNPKTSQITGYSLDELHMKPFKDLIHPDDMEQILSVHSKSIKNNTPRENRFRFVKKSGETRWAQINTVVIDWEGQPATLNFVSDITERKRTEDALYESEERHRALVEASSKAGIGIVILQSTEDQEAVIIFANDGAIQMTGYAREEILSKPLGEFMPPEEFLIALERYRNRQKGTPAVPYYETHITSKSGAMIPVLISAATLKVHGNIATVVFFRDVTQIKESETKLARHTKNMEAILSVARAVSEMTSINKMLIHALERVNEALSVEKSCIYILDREKKCLTMKACRGVSDRNVSRYASLPLSEVQFKNLLQWTSPIVPFEDIFGKETARKMKLALGRNKSQSYTVTPLRIKDTVIGILYIVSDEDRIFSREDMELVRALSYEIAIGIDNAELLERTIAMSLTDELTGLYNRRHFYDSIEMEMYRTKRYGHPFSIALFDLNGFKEYNDRFGHASGDSILQMFAKALKSSFRKTDILCRYGGDEFSIILPSTDDKTAKDIVERFRSKWSNICEKKAPAGADPMGFSCGIVVFPHNSESADGLVFLADAAMYCAKTGAENSSVTAAEISAISSDILRSATRNHIYALAATVDAKDPSTYGHSKRVADIAEKIAKAIGLPPKELSRIYAAALLHDIGKIGVPDSLLTKPARPTPEEWTILRKHSSEGAKIVGYVSELSNLVPIILHHHEWYNGKGYPDKLLGKDIPIGARITSVADAYDTMTTERPYRKIVSSEQACEELIRCSGTQFDPAIVKIWCTAIKEAA